MTGIAQVTKFAFATAGIDFADNPLAHQSIIARLFDDSDELMADRAFESGIAAGDFKIGIANPRQDHADHCFASWLRFGNLTDDGAVVVFNAQSFHGTAVMML